MSPLTKTGATSPTIARYDGTAMRAALQDAAKRARADISTTDDPRAQGLLETTAEAIDGLSKAFADYEEGTELAWKSTI